MNSTSIARRTKTPGACKSPKEATYTAESPEQLSISASAAGESRVSGALSETNYSFLLELRTAERLIEEYGIRLDSFTVGLRTAERLK